MVLVVVVVVAAGANFGFFDHSIPSFPLSSKRSCFLFSPETQFLDLVSALDAREAEKKKQEVAPAGDDIRLVF